MDEPISSQERQARRRRRYALIGCGVLLVAVSAYAVARVGRAAPLVAAEGLWIDTVQEGDISRELHGVGELVPDDDAARWASADVEGRVERKLLESGAIVKAGTVLLELADPDVEQAAVAADLALEQALSAYTSLEASLESELLVAAFCGSGGGIRTRTGGAAGAMSMRRSPKTDCSLKSPRNSRRVRADALTERARLEQNRVTALEHSQKTRLAAQQSEVEEPPHRRRAEASRLGGADGPRRHRRRAAGSRRRSRPASHARRQPGRVIDPCAVEGAYSSP